MTILNNETLDQLFDSKNEYDYDDKANDVYGDVVTLPAELIAD